jgi:multidrug resistance efflux pump
LIQAIKRLDGGRGCREAARAQLEQTLTDLDRMLVRAPVDGVVLQVNVRPGEYVGSPPSRLLVVLGAIDQTIHIRVDIDEHDISRFKPGTSARASLRGSPQVSYRSGSCVSSRM